MNQRVFDIINKISQEHSKKVFGYLDEDDLKNEIWCICLEKLKILIMTVANLNTFLGVS
jgi:hypothetical protein